MDAGPAGEFRKRARSGGTFGVRGDVRGPTGALFEGQLVEEEKDLMAVRGRGGAGRELEAGRVEAAVGGEAEGQDLGEGAVEVRIPGGRDEAAEPDLVERGIVRLVQQVLAELQPWGNPRYPA